MQTYFAVDSSQPTHLGLHAQVSGWLGEPPSVWGRYLLDIKDVSTAITTAEAIYLHNLGTRILVCYNGATPYSVQQDAAHGAGEAAIAVGIAKALSIPAGTALYADIEANWQLSAAWLTGWCTGVAQAGYTPGAYANLFQHVHTDPIRAVLAAGVPLVLWSSEPEPGWQGLDHLPPWPGEAAWFDLTPHVTVWQFVEGIFGDTIDADQLTPKGYDLCWTKAGPPPPVPVAAFQIVTPGALKTAANHTSAVAIDAHHRRVDLELGAIVLPTGRTSTDSAGVAWAEVRLPAPSAVHGWFPAHGIGPEDAHL